MNNLGNKMGNNLGLYCLGNALVDYEFRISEEQLQDMGIVKGQMTLANEGEFTQCFNFLRDTIEYQREGGGSAINSLITYARLGGAGALSCIVADDDSGDFFLQELRNLGITLHLGRSIQRTDAAAKPTGHCIAMITPDAERTMLTYLGINEDLAAYKDISGALMSSGVFYAESYLLSGEKSRNVLMNYLEEARRQNKLIALSMSDVSMVTYFKDEMHEMLKGGVDILFGNLGEFSSYTGEDEPHKIFRCFADNVKTLVITMGEEGAVVYCADGEEKGEDAQATPIPPYATEVHDTLGAGDTYAGAFLYALCEKNTSYLTAGKFASYAAGRVISRMGPRLSMEECQSLLLGFDWE